MSLRVQRWLGPRSWSVRSRLSAVAAAAAAIGLGVAGMVAYVVTSQVLYGQIDKSLQRAPTFADSPGRPTSDLDRLCDVISSARGPSPGLFAVQLVKPDGEVCADDSQVQIELVESDYAAAEEHIGERLRDGGLEDGTAARVATVSLDGGGALVFARDTGSVESVLAILRWSLIGVIVVGSLIALLLSRWAARAGLRPITRFAELAEDIAETGSLDQHVFAEHVTGVPNRSGPRDELSRLSRSFDSMTTALAESQEVQRRLVADAGHELRTPLASLRANIALLQRSRWMGRALPAGVEERLLADLGSQAIELSTLIDDLADLASVESESSPFESIRFDLSVEAAMERARPRASDHTFTVHLEPWTVHGDEPAIQRAAVNLLDNAIKFSAPGTRIEVQLVDGVLSVVDRGVGISGEDEHKVFDRFWRSPRARSLPGSGLGLSIVADVARHHHGWATIEPRPEGGVVAKLFLPAAGPGGEH